MSKEDQFALLQTFRGLFEGVRYLHRNSSLGDTVAGQFDEFLILKFKATNVDPYPFTWLDYNRTCLEYAALLTRVSREYDRRFP